MTVIFHWPETAPSTSLDPATFEPHMSERPTGRGLALYKLPSGRIVEVTLSAGDYKTLADTLPHLAKPTKEVLREDLPSGALHIIDGDIGAKVTYIDSALGIQVTTLDKNARNGAARWFPDFWVNVLDENTEKILIHSLIREAAQAEAVYIRYNGDPFTWPRKSFLWAVTPP